MLEAIRMCEEITGRPTATGTTPEANRIGDHIWWISDVGKFASHYPTWRLTYDVPAHLPGNLRDQRRALAGGGRAMIDRGKHNVLGVRIDAVDYEAAVERIVARGPRRPAAGRLGPGGPWRDDRRARRGPPLSAQPVRPARSRRPAGALGAELLHRARLSDRVYGPELMLRICRAAAERGAADLPVRRHAEMLAALQRRLTRRFPGAARRRERGRRCSAG